MPRIRFFSRQVYDTGGPGQGPAFAPGQVVSADDVPGIIGEPMSAENVEAFLRRWVSRGVAEWIDDDPPEAASPDSADDEVEPDGEPRPAVDVPADWRDLHHAKRRALARQISGGEPKDTDEADAIIAAYVAG